MHIATWNIQVAGTPAEANPSSVSDTLSQHMMREIPSEHSPPDSQ